MDLVADCRKMHSLQCFINVKDNSMYRLYIILFALITSSVSFAQMDLKVKSMTLTTGHIPAAEKRNDYNGQPCALVKIQVVDEVESGGIYHR